MEGLLVASIAFLCSLFCIIAGFIIKLWLDERNSRNSTTGKDAKIGQQQARANRRIEETEAVNEEDENDDQGMNNIDDEYTRPKSSKIPQNKSLQNEDECTDDQFTEKKIGKKKMIKLQAKAEAKAQREQEQSEREERKMREQEVAKELEVQQLLKEKEEQKQKEKLRIEREEKKQREMEEYLKLKETFNVQEHGFDNDEEDNNSENHITQFIDFIQKKKVVHIDDLAAHFRIKTDEVVDRLNIFLQEKRITGVFDDRGLFTFISEIELHEVAKFINQRGRVNLSELAENSNRLVSVTPIG